MRRPSGEALSFYYSVYEVIQTIPYGKVTTYGLCDLNSLKYKSISISNINVIICIGHIAKMVGAPNNARQVGYALKSLPTESEDPNGPCLQIHTGNVPWWRVISSQGKISKREYSTGEERQADRLRAEGVEITDSHYIALEEYGWFPQPMPTDG